MIIDEGARVCPINMASTCPSNLESFHEQRTFPNLPQWVMLQDFVYLDYLVFPALRHISDNKQSHHDWLFSFKCT